MDQYFPKSSSSKTIFLLFLSNGICVVLAALGNLEGIAGLVGTIVVAPDRMAGMKGKGGRFGLKHYQPVPISPHFPFH